MGGECEGQGERHQLKNLRHGTELFVVAGGSCCCWKPEEGNAEALHFTALLGDGCGVGLAFLLRSGCALQKKRHGSSKLFCMPSQAERLETHASLIKVQRSQGEVSVILY